MATYDGRALRAQLMSDFAALAHGIREYVPPIGLPIGLFELHNSAELLKEIHDALIDTILRTMRDLLNQWNRGRAVECLPQEVLASVFIWLPFRERVRAAHVSRSWRAASLNFPAVWADIDMTDTYSDKHRLLDMALSRTGEHPVDLEIALVQPVDDLVTAALKAHMHHIRTFIWSSEPGIPPNASLLAPILEVWQSDVLAVPADFLGGLPGKLSMLDVKLLYLPESCPALSTLTQLIIDPGATDEQSAATLVGLFTLCPALQLLRYGNMPVEFAHLLPAGPAPVVSRAAGITPADSSRGCARHRARYDSFNDSN